MERLRVIDHVGFEAPAGLEDATRWTFGDEARSEALTVELAAPAGRATPAPGYYFGKVDGELGPMTAAALRRFQRAKGLAASGDLDGATAEALRADYGG